MTLLSFPFPIPISISHFAIEGTRRSCVVIVMPRPFRSPQSIRTAAGISMSDPLALSTDRRSSFVIYYDYNHRVLYLPDHLTSLPTNGVSTLTSTGISNSVGSLPHSSESLLCSSWSFSIPILVLTFHALVRASCSGG